MPSATRDKGARGEREVADLLRSYGLDAWRTPNSGGLRTKGDLEGVPGYHFEVKRQEVLRLPLWTRQAQGDADGAIPVVAYRQNRGEWFACLPLGELAHLIANTPTKEEV